MHCCTPTSTYVIDELAFQQFDAALQRSALNFLFDEHVDHTSLDKLTNTNNASRRHWKYLHSIFDKTGWVSYNNSESAWQYNIS